MHWVLRLSIAAAAAVLLLILGIIAWRGMGGMSWEMITKAPEGSFYLGGGGGVLNAILGSLALATGATALAAVIAVPVVLYIHTYAGKSRLANRLRLALDVMWGIPSIVYGAFGFSLMLMVEVLDANSASAGAAAHISAHTVFFRDMISGTASIIT